MQKYIKIYNTIVKASIQSSSEYYKTLIWQSINHLSVKIKGWQFNISITIGTIIC